MRVPCNLTEKFRLCGIVYQSSTAEAFSGQNSTNGYHIEGSASVMATYFDSSNYA